jgi:hypothetical protein
LNRRGFFGSLVALAVALLIGLGIYLASCATPGGLTPLPPPTCDLCPTAEPPCTAIGVTLVCDGPVDDAGASTCRQTPFEIPCDAGVPK